MKEWISDKWETSKEWVMDRKDERTSLDGIRDHDINKYCKKLKGLM